MDCMLILKARAWTWCWTQARPVNGVIVFGTVGLDRNGGQDNRNNHKNTNATQHILSIWPLPPWVGKLPILGRILNKCLAWVKNAYSKNIQKWSTNCFGWVENTYSKHDQKMVAGCPEGYAIDIFKHYYLNMYMADPSGQPAIMFFYHFLSLYFWPIHNIFWHFFEYVFLTHPKPFLSIYKELASRGAMVYNFLYNIYLLFLTV